MEQRAESGPEGGAPRDETIPSRRRRRSTASAVEELPGTAYAAIASRVLLVGTVMGSVLAIGTVHTMTLLVVALGAFAACALAIYAHATPKEGAPSLSLPVVVCLALAGWSLLQALPLPFGVVRALASANADVWERALVPFGEAAPRWVSLSLDPGASVVEALKWAVYAAVFATAAGVSARRGVGWGALLLFVSAIAAAFTTVGHGLAAATKVFGLYQPTFGVSSWHVGPLLNPNNLAGYLNLGVLAGLGLLLMRKPIVPPWLVGLGVALLVGVDITSASRGGVLVLPVGVIALASLARQAANEPGRSSAAAFARRWASASLMVVAVGGGVVLAALGGTREAWAELYEKNISKLEMVGWMKPLVLDHPIFGVGRGAFESVFPVYRTVPGDVVFTHAENFPAQWASEWGLPVTIAALAAFAWCFSPRRLGVRRSASAAGLWVGVAVLLLQNLVDLALEVPGVCIAVAVALGSLWGDERRRPLSSKERDLHRVPLDPAARGRALVAMAAIGALLVGLAVPFRTTDVASERAALKAMIEDRTHDLPGASAALRARLRAAILRHPAEPYFPLVGALVAFRAHDQSPMPWLQRTLERGQVNGKAHLLLAEVLAARGGKAQALFELRLAVESDPTLAGPAAQLAVRLTRGYDELLAAVPEGEPGNKMLDWLAISLRAPEDRAARVRFNRELIRRSPGEVGPRYREAEERLQALMSPDPAAAGCADRDACRREIVEHAMAISAAQPDGSLGAQLRARLLLADGKAEEATSLLEAACEKANDRPICLSARAGAAAKLKEPARLEAASRELLSSVCASAAKCAETASWLGELRTGRGDVQGALLLFQRAAREEATDARLYRLADAAKRAGAHAIAVDALKRIAQRHGGADAELRKRIDAEQSDAMGGLLQPR